MLCDYCVQSSTSNQNERSSSRQRTAPKNYIPSMVAAKKWNDDGTTGVKLTEKDVDKLCEEWTAKVDKARAKKMKTQERLESNQQKVLLLKKEIATKKTLMKQHKSLNNKLYAKFTRAHSKYRNVQEAHAFFLHKLVQQHLLPEDAASIEDSDVTVPMTPSSNEDDDSSTSAPSSCEGNDAVSVDY